MTKFAISDLAGRLARLTVYRNLLNNPAVAAWRRALATRDAADAAAVFAAALEAGFGADVGRAILSAVLYDDNAFARALSRGEGANLSPALRRAALYDLETLEALMFLNADDLNLENSDAPVWEPFRPDPDLFPDGRLDFEALGRFYRRHGTGPFARFRFFVFDGDLRGVRNPDPVRLGDLKEYESERRLVYDNLARFAAGHPANHMLLHGDKGTGKSATVHACANELAENGLRLIEFTKQSLKRLPDLTGRLGESPLRFLLFADDLSFSPEDDDYAALKAVLEGGAEAVPKNCLLCATSNRRHLVRERFSDREGDDLHVSDTLEEQHSLADRFGLTVTFRKPDRTQYLNIVRALAADRGIRLPEDELCAAAERWALAKGGRSPRAAVQFLLSLPVEPRA